MPDKRFAGFTDDEKQWLVLALGWARASNPDDPILASLFDEVEGELRDASA